MDCKPRLRNHGWHPPASRIGPTLSRRRTFSRKWSGWPNWRRKAFSHRKNLQLRRRSFSPGCERLPLTNPLSDMSAGFFWLSEPMLRFLSIFRLSSLSRQSFSPQPFQILGDLLLLVFGQGPIRWMERVACFLFAFTHD